MGGMHKALLTLILTLAPTVVLAQMPGGPTTPLPISSNSQLIKYLGLEVNQTIDLWAGHLEFQRYLAGKTLRVAQVEAELRVETLKDVIDPLALGMRYAELEAICREARDTQKKTQERARKLLTAAQLAKMQVLDQAYALLPVIAEADTVHLMNAPIAGIAQSAAASQVADTAGLPGCRSFPTLLVFPMPLEPGQGAGGQ